MRGQKVGQKLAVAELRVLQKFLRRKRRHMFTEPLFIPLFSTISARLLRVQLLIMPKRTIYFKISGGLDVFVTLSCNVDPLQTPRTPKVIKDP